VNVVRIAIAELVGMFIDDGNLALFALILVTAVAAAVNVLGLSPQWGAALLLAGCPAILTESIRRAARQRD
jgi:hypothetical protein